MQSGWACRELIVLVCAHYTEMVLPSQFYQCGGVHLVVHWWASFAGWEKAAAVAAL
ncbi:hypothetical protein [Roseibium algae]|uniref:Uncharacterized protein n=1 Tax=Roseibium algae TaxID=3123038 RepID=A0ABU8TEZ8_9HYPH